MELKRKNQKEIRQCIEAQARYCSQTGAPHFAPEDGRCYRCGQQIYQNIGHDDCNTVTTHGAEVEYVTGISLEKASKELITGCPHCHYSYCD